MSITDPIADMLTVIRNGSSAKKEKVDVKASKLGQSILEILKKKRVIKNYKLIEDNKQGILRVYLKFTKDKKPAITNLRRISKPGLRVYVKKEDITHVLGGFGFAILSTSKGILTNREAKEANVGGEVLFHVW